MRIAWLGTGLLGLPMAGKLHECGHDVVAWNRTRAKTAPLRSRGLRIANTSAEAIRDAQCVCLMLADASAIEAVLFGDKPQLEARTVLQMGTIGPSESRRLAERVAAVGADYLEAPVLGSIPQAESATLLIMVGGTAEQFERWRTLFACLGRDPIHVGPVGSAATLKLALNQLIASLTTAFSVSLGMTRRAGIDVELFMRILRESALFAPTFEKKFSRMLERNFANPNFPTGHLLKDVLLIRDAAEGLGIHTDSLDGIERIIRRALDLGHERSDYSALHDAVDPRSA